MKQRQDRSQWSPANKWSIPILSRAIFVLWEVATPLAALFVCKSRRLLSIASHVVSLLHQVGSPCKAASFKEGLSQVTFSWKLPNSTLCLSWRYDCYSADNGLCAAGAKTEIDVLAIQRILTDTSINRLSDSSLRGCFDAAFLNRAQSWHCYNELSLKKKKEMAASVSKPWG